MEKPTIYYIYDALCGWCYGFSPVIQKFQEKYRDQYKFNVLSGGMVLGDREGPIGEVASYIKDAYKRVEETSGIKFGKAFLEVLEEGSAKISSLPPSVAMAVFKSFKPDEAIAFAAKLQKAIYYEGLPVAEMSTYINCIKEFDIDVEAFEKMMTDQKFLELAKEEFKVVAHWGIQGFPSVVYMKDQHAYLIARGFAPIEKLEETIKNVEAEIARK